MAAGAGLSVQPGVMILQYYTSGKSSKIFIISWNCNVFLPTKIHKTCEYLYRKKNFWKYKFSKIHFLTFKSSKATPDTETKTCGQIRPYDAAASLVNMWVSEPLSLIVWPCHLVRLVFRWSNYLHFMTWNDFIRYWTTFTKVFTRDPSYLHWYT